MPGLVVPIFSALYIHPRSSGNEISREFHIIFPNSAAKRGVAIIISAFKVRTSIDEEFNNRIVRTRPRHRYSIVEGCVSGPTLGSLQVYSVLQEHFNYPRIAIHNGVIEYEASLG